MEAQKRQRALGPGLADQGEADGVGDIMEIDEHFLALLERGGITDQLAGEGVDACVVHGGG